MNKKQPETTCNILQQARNDLEQPTTTWKDLEQTRNDLETTYNEQETTWNDPTSKSKTQPTTTQTYLQQAKKTRNDQQQADFEIILEYRAISSLL